MSTSHYVLALFLIALTSSQLTVDLTNLNFDTSAISTEIKDRIIDTYLSTVESLHYSPAAPTTQNVQTNEKSVSEIVADAAENEENPCKKPSKFVTFLNETVSFITLNKNNAI